MKSITHSVVVALAFVFAIALIENDGNSWMAETSGDIFGALGLMFLGACAALQDDD